MDMHTDRQRHIEIPMDTCWYYIGGHIQAEVYLHVHGYVLIYIETYKKRERERERYSHIQRNEFYMYIVLLTDLDR